MISAVFSRFSGGLRGCMYRSDQLTASTRRSCRNGENTYRFGKKKVVIFWLNA